MIVEVVELSEKFSATWVVAFQNFETPISHRVAVLEDAEVSCVGRHKALALTALLLGAWSLVGEDLA